MRRDRFFLHVNFIHSCNLKHHHHLCFRELGCHGLHFKPARSAPDDHDRVDPLVDRRRSCNVSACFILSLKRTGADDVLTLQQNSSATIMAEQVKVDRAIAKAPVRRMMKEVGAFLVAEDAVMCIINFLETMAKNISKKGLIIAEMDGRKKITGADITAATKQ
jgi:histone H3/H4